MEYASIATRLAPSFIRIGNFQTFNPPEEIFYLFGGGAGGKKDWEGLRILGEWVVKRVLKLDVQEGEAWGKKLVLEVARRNAEMLGGWQAYGFMVRLFSYCLKSLELTWELAWCDEYG